MELRWIQIPIRIWAEMQNERNKKSTIKLKLLEDSKAKVKFVYVWKVDSHMNTEIWMMKKWIFLHENYYCTRKNPFRVYSWWYEIYCSMRRKKQKKKLVLIRDVLREINVYAYGGRIICIYKITLHFISF